MTRARSGWIAWGLVAVSIVGATIGAVLRPDPGSWVAAVGEVCALAAFAIVGAVIVHRQAGNTIGWVLIGIGSLMAISDVFRGWTHQLYTATTVPSDQAAWVAWIASWVWGPGFVLAFVVLPLLFPDGRLPSRRWRPVAWVARSLFLAFPAAMIAPGPLDVDRALALPDNPLGVGGVLGSVASAVELAAEIVFIPVLIAVTASLVVRWRRSRGVERQQLKWFATAMVGVMSLFLVSMMPVPQAALDGAAPVVFVAMPISIGVAVLRYRLYEIDRIINRTLVYTVVVAVLGLVYYGSVVGLQTMLPTRGSDLAVAASTLAVAAAFGPVRRRVQWRIDRRFNRARYDASRTVETFAQRLRDEVDVATIRTELSRTVAAAVQPGGARVWLVVDEGPRPAGHAGSVTLPERSARTTEVVSSARDIAGGTAT